MSATVWKKKSDPYSVLGQLGASLSQAGCTISNSRRKLVGALGISIQCTSEVTCNGDKKPRISHLGPT